MGAPTRISAINITLRRIASAILSIENRVRKERLRMVLTYKAAADIVIGTRFVPPKGRHPAAFGSLNPRRIAVISIDISICRGRQVSFVGGRRQFSTSVPFHHTPALHRHCAQQGAAGDAGTSGKMPSAWYCFESWHESSG
jgi:hypothetical protein